MEMENIPVKRVLFALILWFTINASLLAQTQILAQPRTAAEISDFKETTRHADVLAFCTQLAKQSPRVRLADMGTTYEGRKLPLVIIAEPPVTSPEEAHRDQRLVIFAMGNIHAGEVDGKEALLMLARELAFEPSPALLKDLILVFAPNFNADGGERLGKHRPEQAGPMRVGTRANAQGFDLNRDFIKLESPEVRALVRFLNRWNPAVLIDCHTTNGSYHRYTMTYEGSRCPAGDRRIIEYTRDRLLPDVSRRLKKSTGIESFFYGNFSHDRSRWETVPPTPRYSIHYAGLRHCIGILSESYSYAPYRDRILGSKAFVRCICEHVAANRKQIRTLLNDARQAASQPGRHKRIALRQKPAPVGRPVNILGFVEESKDGRHIPTVTPRSYEVLYMGGAETTLSVRLPYAYLLPPSFKAVVANLQRHGIAVDELREDIDLDVEFCRVNRIERAAAFQKHQPVTLEVSWGKRAARVKSGTIMIRTAQPLGNLAAYLLEPQSADGLVTWNFFDSSLGQGKEFPVWRLVEAVPITFGRVRPLAEDRKWNRPITFEALHGSERRLSFHGNPVSSLTWLDDGLHFLQVKEGRLLEVEARTGRSRPLFDPDKLAAGLASLPAIGPDAARSLAQTPGLHMNAQRTAAIFQHENDLYYCKLDGSGAARLTHSPASEELVSFSPDGRFVAFVRGNNLFVVDIPTRTERALTTDGNDLVSNGRADWVYFEEIFHRKWKAYWWAPDSSRIAFFRYDDAPVHRFPLVDPLEVRPVPEITPYPKAGAPNPRVRIGIVTVGGGAPQWVDLGNYSENSSLLVRAGWLPDSRKVYFYIQDRAQTWLDFCTASARGGQPRRLFRETTRAWVEDPGPPTFLGDGSFLWSSERSGWKHIYHYNSAGKLIRPITSGEWEARTLHHVDEASGWVYVSGTRDSHIAVNLYRVKLDGSRLERLTGQPGDHRVGIGPKADLFIDWWSNHETPTQVRLYAMNKSLVRTLDTNPVYEVEEYRRGRHELMTIVTADGFPLQASLLKPPDFDERKRYPVWFMTYGGPHAPTIRDSWADGRLRDEMLAQMGYLVFRCDPRSASGRGACSTWTAYRQLGVQELHDIETAIRWLTKHTYVDARRIGMSGHSYGGFMTAFALTHSKLFAAGIAGAPVTDWHNYDSIYTERYMNTPQENPKGYKETSVVAAAGNLHGKLLIVHGLMDDNVHAQNTFQLMTALQQADKDFAVMFYPRNRHGVSGRHFERLAVEFMKQALHPGEGTFSHKK
jgi:dipeptidyl-peptidase 4